MRFLYSRLLFLVAGKASRVPKVTYYSPWSLNNFWNFPWYANHCCTGHATTLTKLGNDRLVTVHTIFLAIVPNQKPLISNIAVNVFGHKFENDLHKTLKESLALFPVDELKAEQRFIDTIVVRRGVSGQFQTGYGKSLALGVSSSLKAKGYEFCQSVGCCYFATYFNNYCWGPGEVPQVTGSQGWLCRREQNKWSRNIIIIIILLSIQKNVR